MQSHTTKILICAALLMFVCGCATVKPPTRPVAYLYPTVMPMSELKECHSRQVSALDVRSYLEQAGVLQLLEKDGLLAGDLELVARGLVRRGYAELDARRTSSHLQWVAFLSREQDITLICGFRKMPPETACFCTNTNEGKEHFETDPYGRTKIIREYPCDKPGAKLRRIRTGEKLHWETSITIPFKAETNKVPNS